jgi:dihydrofolate reductase
MNGIFAIDEFYGFGRQNRLPWKCQEDLEFFKNKTMGNTVIMGKNTWNSVPQRLFLKTRNVIVVTKEQIQGITTAENVEDAKSLAQKNNNDIFVIGGMKLLLSCFKENVLDNLYITRIQGVYECDVYFKEVEQLLSRYKLVDKINCDGCCIENYTRLP